MNDDATLMRRVQAGETAPFEELVRRYRGPLARVAFSKLGDAAGTEDVVQETFLAVFAARATFNPRFAFRTWLWTILLRLCARRRLRGQRPGEIGGLIDPQLADQRPAAADSVLAQVLRDEEQSLVHAALAELPEAEADALRLRFFGGLKFEEIAIAMQSSVSGAKQRVKHGLERLSVRFQPAAGDRP
jgi:RNA polymerase sigma-70 factor (ECF subfamily)